MPLRFDDAIDTHELYDQQEFRRNSNKVSSIWGFFNGLDIFFSYAVLMMMVLHLQEVSGVPRYCKILPFITYIFVCLQLNRF